MRQDHIDRLSSPDGLADHLELSARFPVGALCMEVCRFENSDAVQAAWDSAAAAVTEGGTELRRGTVHEVMAEQLAEQLPDLFGIPAHSIYITRRYIDFARDLWTPQEIAAAVTADVIPDAALAEILRRWSDEPATRAQLAEAAGRRDRGRDPYDS